MAARGSRLQKSVYTYGPVGRVLWTLASLGILYLLLAPVWRLARGGLIFAGIGAMVPLFFGVAGVILLVFVWPRYIRDVWQRASVDGAELPEVRTPMPPPTDVEPLSQRTGPTRW